MVKWKFWQRSADTTTDTELPPEVQEYYESTRRGRKGIAIILGIVTVIVTLLLAAVLYFAGRYLWRTFFDSSDEPAPITQQEQAPTDLPAESSSDQSGQEQTGTSSDSTDEPATNGDSSGDASDEPSGLPAGDSNSGSESNSARNSSTDAGKQTSPNEVPDTGPGSVLAIAAGTAVASGVAYEVVGRRKARD